MRLQETVDPVAPPMEDEEFAEMQMPAVQQAPRDDGNALLPQGEQAELPVEDFQDRIRLDLPDDETSELTQEEKMEASSMAPQAVSFQVERVIMAPPMFTVNQECAKAIQSNIPKKMQRLSKTVAAEKGRKITDIEKLKRKLNQLKEKLLASGKLNYKQSVVTLLAAIKTDKKGCNSLVIDRKHYYTISEATPQPHSKVRRQAPEICIRSSQGDSMTIKAKVATINKQKLRTGKQAIDAKTYADGLQEALNTFSLGDPEKYRFI